MVLREVKPLGVEGDLLLEPDEGVKVQLAVLVSLLRYDVLDYSVLLLEVLQGGLRWDWALRVGEEPPLGLNLLLKFHKSILRKVIL